MESEYPREYQAGRYARQAQRDENRCPFYEMGDEGRRRREAWRRGWNDEDKLAQATARKGSR